MSNRSGAVVRLADVEHSGVQQWVSDITRRGSGATTVIRAYGVLAAILDEAVKDRLLASNPARGVKLPRKKPKPRAYLSDAQVWKLADEAGRQGCDRAATGLHRFAVGRTRRAARRRCRHVAPPDHVHRNAVNVGGEIVVGTPKTHAERAVVFPKFLAEFLASACEGKGRDDVVFPNRFGHYAAPPGVSTWFSGA